MQHVLGACYILDGVPGGSSSSNEGGDPRPTSPLTSPSTTLNSDVAYTSHALLDPQPPPPPPPPLTSTPPPPPSTPSSYPLLLLDHLLSREMTLLCLSTDTQYVSTQKDIMD